MNAALIMERACPDLKARKFLMAQLLKSVSWAEARGPNSWAVTLFNEGFRLNVGQCEALTYLNRLVRYFMLGSVPAQAHTVGEILPASFRSLPQPQWAFYGSAAELKRLHSALAPGHKLFVQTAAVTTKGKPRRCPYMRYHSPALYDYALKLAA